MSIHHHTYENGLVLVAEEMPFLESAAFSFRVPLGSAYDPPQRGGLSSLVCEMIQRGCDDLSSREFLDALERLGVEGGESVSQAHTSYDGATLADHLPDALSIYAKMFLQPHMPVDQMEEGRLVALQELRGVEDDPSHKAMIELRRRHQPAPWGQPGVGDQDAIETITIDDVKQQYELGYRPNGTILGVAGKFNWTQLQQQVGELFGDWQVTDWEEPSYGPHGEANHHIPYESEQTHVCLAYDSIPYRHEDYFDAWGAVSVLSGGSSSRLFTEVREKRGLCYTVSAAHRTLRNLGSVNCYAGTSADRAQETLDVMVQEILRLFAGVEADEVNRLKARIKSGLLMQQESSISRSASIAADWYHLQRVLTFDEISNRVDRITAETISRYLADHPPQHFTLLTLGPSPLEVPDGIS